MLQPGWKRYISKWWQRSEIILIIELTLIFLVKSFFTGKNTDLKSHRINMWVGIWGAKCPSSHCVICPFRMNFDFNGLNYLVIGLVPIRATGICTLGLFPSRALRTLRSDKIINSRIREYQSWPTAAWSLVTTFVIFLCLLFAWSESQIFVCCGINFSFGCLLGHNSPVWTVCFWSTI